MIDPAILAYYSEQFSEAERLAADANRLEYLRTVDILARHLPPPPAVVVDVGGGPGIYSRWLLERGYEPRLVDPVPRHLEQARAALAAVAAGKPWSVQAGHGASLPFESECAGAVLCMGPLYHLPDREQRIAALREAWRVMRPGAILAATAISRFASLIDGLHSGCIDDPAFRGIIDGDLASGMHRNPTGNPYYWTNAFFHRPDELMAEFREAGLKPRTLLAVEGVGWTAKDLGERLATSERLEILLEYLRRVEAEPALLGVSPHLMAIAAK